MTTASPEFRIEPQLPVLACNFEQLQAWATGLTERYANMVVTEDALVEVKKDMAELNKHKARLEDARKETVRQVSEPIRAFESQIKEVVGIFDSAYAGLSGQVKAFEEAQREEKRSVVEGIIREEVTAAFAQDAPRPNIPVQDKWLNKTTSLKTIREDVAAIIQRHIEEEQRRKALEQARHDRAAAIESHVQALNEKYNLNMPVSRFLVGMGMNTERTLSNVLADITQAYADAIELRQAEEAARKTLAECSSPVSDKKPCHSEIVKSERQAPAQTRAMSIVLEYDVANEARVKACLETLNSLCVNFGARYR